MFVFAIVLNDPNEDAWETVKSGWPNAHFILTDRIAFVAQSEVAVTRQIADQIGLGPEKKIKGLVLEADNRAGWNNRDFIEWMGKVS